MHTFFENNIRGGISVVSHRLAEAQNKDLPGFDTDKTSSYIMNFDANLYAFAESRKLPAKGFRFLNDDELTNFDANSIDVEGDDGYVCEVDLLYSQP